MLARPDVGSHAKVISALGISALAAALGVSAKKVDGWKTRSSIPGPWFALVVKAAADLGRGDITLELLADLAASKVGPPGDIQPAAAPS